MNKDFKILCLYYINNDFIPRDELYYPIQCGKAYTYKDLGIFGDDTGDNISSRNTYWSEITGLYWAWKNMAPVRYIGLCSYRRYFNFNHKPFIPMIKILPKKEYSQVDNIQIPEISNIFKKYDIILPKKYWYAYSLRNVCRMNYYYEDFEILRDVINSLYPDYTESYDRMLHYENKGYGHNMFIMRWKMFEDYCQWVFDILLEAEKRINASDYPIDKIRVFGYMHEVLLSLYVYKNNLRVYESQLTWITDETKTSQFNSLLYKIACDCSFFFNKPRHK